MAFTIADIREEVSCLEIEGSLRFLNHLLAVSRLEWRDPTLDYVRERHGVFAPAFLCHFLAKEIVVHGSCLAPFRLNLTRFQRLVSMYFKLSDPILQDPSWKHRNPSGFTERLLSHQLRPQRHIAIQDFGLALALFGEISLGANLRGDCERVLGVPIENWMQFGFLCAVATRVRSNRAMVNLRALRNAQSQGISVATETYWEPFFRRASASPDRFREEHGNVRGQDEQYAPFEQNPLERYPLIEVSPGSYVAPDPDLIIQRATWGIFGDLLELHGGAVPKAFGASVSNLIGKLLRSAVPEDSLWCDRDGNKRTEGKRGDWAYIGRESTVLIECKSARPTPWLQCEGSERGVAYASRGVAKALRQLHEQDTAIQRGEWRHQGLIPRRVSYLVVTYGQYFTLNGEFFRAAIKRELVRLGVTLRRPYVVLSVREFDSLIGLVETDKALDQVVEVVASHTRMNVLDLYRPDLQEHAVSKLAERQGNAILDALCKV